MNPVVFLDFGLFGENIGRVKIELEADLAPRASENFRQLCTGEFKIDRRPVGFKSCLVRLKVQSGCLMIESGNFDGRGGLSIYGTSGMVIDSLVQPKHDVPGTVTMLPEGGGSLFAILPMPIPVFDGKCQVVGRVVEGMAIIRRLEAILMDRSVPPDSLSILQCGQMY